MPAQSCPYAIVDLFNIPISAPPFARTTSCLEQFHVGQGDGVLKG